MPTFAFRAVDASGRRHRGREEAATPAALSSALEQRGWVVLDVAPDAGEAAPGLAAGGRRRGVLEVTRALGALLAAGMPLARALATARHVATGGLPGVLDAVRTRVERGDGLATALANHPQYFSALYVGVVRAGEKSGALAPAFGRLAEQLEKEEALRGRLVSASIYPGLLALAGGAAVLVLLLFVLPRFVGLLEGAGAALPRSTALLLDASQFAQRAWPALLVAAAAMLAGSLWAARSAAGRRAGGALLLALPGVGTVWRDALGARFARLLGVLLGGGAPLLGALEDTAESIGDPLARDETRRIRGRVREGVALNRALAEGGFFPPLLVQLVAVGEESGRVEAFLLKGAAILEERVERVLHRGTTLIEPAMILAFGAVIAFVALSLLQAIYGVNADAFR